jgi:hypothetical protein
MAQLLEIMDSTVFMKIMIMLYTDNPNPQDNIAKLLPFPNKSKIINAIEYEIPSEEFCCYGYFKKLQNKRLF